MLHAKLKIMKLPLYQVDAFAGRLFQGNPAAVCPLERWLEPSLMQAIAAENNLSETAFFVRTGEVYELRWFTPKVEVDLCGHATLGSAFVILHYLDPNASEVRFETRSGELRVCRAGDGMLALDFPARPPVRCADVPALAEALGRQPRELWESRDYMALYDSEDEIRALSPDMASLARIGHFAVIVTAPGRDADFVSRFFAPASGVSEDPVTGSAHTTLTPYWAERLGKTKLRALQVSERGGELLCEQRGGRVTIAGHVAPYLEGTITV
jgi:PhzF family phenazine biosynthesis protein